MKKNYKIVFLLLFLSYSVVIMAKTNMLNCTIDAGNNVSICRGKSTTLTASGGDSYSWSSGATTATITVNPTITTTYTLTGYCSGVSATDQVIVTVNTLPTVDAGSNVENKCYGINANFTATASGYGTLSYSWSNSATTQSISVNPNINTTYVVTVTDGNGCTASDNARATVINPSVWAGPNKVICLGEQTSIDAVLAYSSYDGHNYTNDFNYSWSPTAGLSSSNILTPTANPTTSTLYKLTATSKNYTTCSATSQVWVTVPHPAQTESFVCYGVPFTLDACNETNFKYTWSTGDTVRHIQKTLYANTTYTVTIGIGGSSSCVYNIIMTVNNPTVNVSAIPSSICNGSNSQLNAALTTTPRTGVTPTYTWLPAGSLSSTSISNPIATPTNSTTYTVTTKVWQCTSTNNLVVTVNSRPSVSAGSNVTICSGNTITLTASGGNTYLWSNDSTNTSIIVSPLVTTTYTVTGTNTNQCTNTSQVIVTVNPLPTVIAGSNQTICSGDTSILIASGVNAYLWSNDSSNATIAVRPTITTTYTVTGTNTNQCSNSAQVVITVNSKPIANAGTDATICPDNTITFSATGGDSYLWDIGLPLAEIKVNPSVTTTYTVTVTQNGCTASDDVVIFVDQDSLQSSPHLSFQSIFLNDSTVLFLNTSSILNDTIFKWNFGDCSDSSYCIAYTNDINQTITHEYLKDGYVNVSLNSEINGKVYESDKQIYPQVLKMTDQDICLGTCTTLNSVSSAQTYTWSDGYNVLGTDQTILVCPTVSTTYYLTTTSNGVTSTDQTIVSVNPPPTFTSFTINNSFNNRDNELPPYLDLTLCDQNSQKIILSVLASSSYGGVTYQWNLNNLTSRSIAITKSTVNKPSNGIYSVTVSDALGCTNETHIYIPYVSGAVQQDFNNINTTGGFSYTSHLNGVCSRTQACVPDPITMNAEFTSGHGNTVLWFLSNNLKRGDWSDVQYIGSTINDEQITVANSSQVYYNAVSSNRNGCLNEYIAQIDYYNYSVSVNSASICSGSSATLTATSPITDAPLCYSWSNGATTSSITVSPTSTTTYEVSTTINDIYSPYHDIRCFPVLKAKVGINEIIINNGSDLTICNGQSLTLTANNSTNCVWSNGATTSSITVSPISTTTYYVTGTIQSGGQTCVDITGSIIVHVNSLPVIDAGTDVTICRGNSTTLTANNNTNYTYIWSSYKSGSSISVDPQITTTYVVTANYNGCTATDDVIVYVKDNVSTVNAGEDKTICVNSTTTLIATGGYTYSWSDGQQSAGIKVSPPTTTTYTVTAYKDICFATDNTVITVISPVANAGSDQTILSGSVTLTATGGSSYSWSSGDNTANLNVTPAQTTSYVVTVIDNNGCSASDGVKVVVGNGCTYIADAGVDQSIIGGMSAVLSVAEGTGLTYSWSTTETTHNITVTPAQTMTYIVSVFSNENLCTSTDAVVVKVYNLSAGTDVSICKGSDIRLIASGATTYSWSNGGCFAMTSVHPDVTTTYTVTGTTGGCSNTASVVVTVNNVPNVTINGEHNNYYYYINHVCSGSSISLTAAGASTYSWSTGENTASVTLSPISYGLRIYTVSGTSNSCSNTAAAVAMISSCNNEAEESENVNSDNTVSKTINNENIINKIEKSGSDYRINIYPNPGDGLFTTNIYMTKKSDIKLTLYNPIGIKVFEQNFKDKEFDFKTNINIQNLSSGLYLLVAETNDGIRTVGVVKQ